MRGVVRFEPAAIRQARKEQRYTQHQLGELCGVDQARISDIELGKESPRVWLLVRILKALGLKPTDVLRRVK